MRKTIGAALLAATAALTIGAGVSQARPSDDMGSYCTPGHPRKDQVGPCWDRDAQSNNNSGGSAALTGDLVARLLGLG